MLSYAQPRTFSATVLLYVAAALRSAAYRVRAVAGRVNGHASVALTCEQCGADADDVNQLDQCSVDAGDAHKLNDVAHLDSRLLKDIGAPHWLVARAAERSNSAHLRWITLDHS